MKIKYLLIYAILITGCVSTIPKFDNCDFDKQTNLVNNGCFDKISENGHPEGWLIIGDKSLIARVEEKKETDHEHCLFLSNLGTETDVISDYFKVNPSEVFFSEAKIKSNRHSNKMLKFSIVAFDKNGNVVNSFLEEFYVENEWSKIKVSSGFLSTSARYARVIFTVPSGSKYSLWIDDVQCYSAYKFLK